MSDETEGTIPESIPVPITPAAVPAREGLALAPAKGEESSDGGVFAVYPGLPPEQWVKFRSVLTDSILDTATEAATRDGKVSNAVFRRTLIRAMVLDCNVKDRNKNPDVENAVFNLLDDVTLQRLPSQFLAWCAVQINRLDGSVAGKSKVVIAGRECDFLPAA